jgi:hypothetical protein
MATGSNTGSDSVAGGTPRAGRFRTLTAVGTVALAVVLGCFGGYLAGRSTGEDLDSARAAGAQLGQMKGRREGALEGRRAGLRAGHKLGFRQTYPDAYRTAYSKAFEEAGLSAPEQVSVPK